MSLEDPIRFEEGPEDGPVYGRMIPANEINWARVKRDQAHLASIASGMLAAILRREANEIELRHDDGAAE